MVEMQDIISTVLPISGFIVACFVFAGVVRGWLGLLAGLAGGALIVFTIVLLASPSTSGNFQKRGD